jgi:two-component system, chemotaxis family, protein-glutamate methylesterase/glutaminase
LLNKTTALPCRFVREIATARENWVWSKPLEDAAIMNTNPGNGSGWHLGASGLEGRREVCVVVERDAEKGAGSAVPEPSPGQGFTGIVNLQLTDLLQMFCLARGDLLIQVKSGEQCGTIHVREGQLFHAQTETLQGEAAFYQILRWKDGQFVMLPFQHAGIQSLDKPWEHLLLEAMRQRDENPAGGGAAMAAPDLELSVAGAPAPVELEQELDGLFDELESIGRDLSGSRAEEAAEQPSDDSLHGQTIKVLIVDDSSFFVQQLRKLLEADPSIEVAAVAKNGQEALELLASDPAIDLITLDVNMPIMKGDTALKHIMVRHPIPVLIVSSFQPHSLDKIFEFLQVGAIDFFSKPHAQEDITSYGERLRNLVRRVAQAKASHFRRWRKVKAPVAAVSAPAAAATDNILVVLGAEGAYMDWFRLPLGSLCAQGLVLGLQKLSDPFLARFCQQIEAGTDAKTEPLVRSERLRPGSFFLGTASQRVRLRLAQGSLALHIERLAAEELEWREGIEFWLEQLAVQAGERLSVHLLSAAHSLKPDLLNTLLTNKCRLILAPRDSVMCTGLVDSVERYSPLYPQQVFRGSPERLMEVWLNNERND